MQTKQYNGWTNYETWNVKLWIWADLLGAALSEVNWYEIASSLLENVEAVEEDKP